MSSSVSSSSFCVFVHEFRRIDSTENLRGVLSCSVFGGCSDSFPGSGEGHDAGVDRGDDVFEKVCSSSSMASLVQPDWDICSAERTDRGVTVTEVMSQSQWADVPEEPLLPLSSLSLSFLPLLSLTTWSSLNRCAWYVLARSQKAIVTWYASQVLYRGGGEKWEENEREWKDERRKPGKVVDKGGVWSLLGKRKRYVSWSNQGMIVFLLPLLLSLLSPYISSNSLRIQSAIIITPRHLLLHLHHWAMTRVSSECIWNMLNILPKHIHLKLFQASFPRNVCVYRIVTQHETARC